MKLHRPILTQHRLRRLVLWTLATLSWFAAVLLSNRPITRRHAMQRGDICLAWLTRAVSSLLMIRALHIIGRTPRLRPRYWMRGRDTRPSHFLRSLFGARLRRMLKHKDPATHIAQLICVLRNLHAYAAHLARCMRGRRRRLFRTLPPMAPAVTLRGAPAPTPAFSDSS
jgi:hypothetical protein